MYVREVGLNSTTFVTWDGKRMYYPNNVISQKPIHNVRRSPNMTDKIGKTPCPFILCSRKFQVLDSSRKTKIDPLFILPDSLSQCSISTATHPSPSSSSCAQECATT